MEAQERPLLRKSETAKPTGACSRARTHPDRDLVTERRACADSAHVDSGSAVSGAASAASSAVCVTTRASHLSGLLLTFARPAGPELPRRRVAQPRLLRRRHLLAHPPRRARAHRARRPWRRRASLLSGRWGSRRSSSKPRGEDNVRALEVHLQVPLRCSIGTTRMDVGEET